MAQSGKFDKRVELQQATPSRDKTGGVTRDWATIVTRWANMKPVAGMEKFEAEQMEARTTMVIRIRWYAAIDTTWRVKRGSLIYNISSLVNEGMEDSIIMLQCTENEGRQDGEE